MFGWVFASHQLGAAIAATAAGALRDEQGSYDLAWVLAGGLCGIAAVASISIRPPRRPIPVLEPDFHTRSRVRASVTRCSC